MSETVTVTEASGIWDGAILGRLGAFVSAGLYGLLAWQMWELWSRPDMGDAKALETFVILIAFEFIMAHSGLFMSLFVRWKALLLLVPVYGLFAWAFTAAAPDSGVVWIYLLAIASRVRFALSNPSAVALNRNFYTSLVAMLLYFGLLIAASIATDAIPVRGLTSETLQIIGYESEWLPNADRSLPQPSEMTSLPDVPHVFMAVGVVYFSALAVVEIVMSFLRPKWSFAMDIRKDPIF